MYKALRGNPERDFFEQNPDFRYLTAVQDLCDIHGPEKASRLLWALYLLEHPDSTMFRIPRDKRKAEIETHYLKEEFPEGLESVKEEMLMTTLTPTKYAYKAVSEQIYQLAKYMREQSLEEAPGKTLDLVQKFAKAWKDLKAIEAEVKEEDSKSQLRGGGRKSKREQRS